jgi:hypothetical protein
MESSGPNLAKSRQNLGNTRVREVSVRLPPSLSVLYSLSLSLSLSLMHAIQKNICLVPARLAVCLGVYLAGVPACLPRRAAVAVRTRAGGRASECSCVVPSCVRGSRSIDLT